MNALIDSETAALLDAYSPQPSAQPDWHDVLRRAPDPRGRTGMRGWALRGGAAVALAAAVLALVSLWPENRGSVVQQALAAMGTGPVLHAVLRTDLGAKLVDLRTGATSPVSATTELWIDPRVGVAEQTRLRGAAGERSYLLVKGVAGIGAHIDEGPAGWLGGYRAALRSGQVRVVGHGRVDGVAVEWLEAQPFVVYDAASGAGTPARRRVAIDARTFRPVYIETVARGRVVSALRVLRIGTTSLAASPLAQPPRRAPLVATTPGVDTPSLGLADAAAALGRAPIVPPHTLAGLRRVWVGRPLYQVGSSFTQMHEPPGVVLFYGHTLNFGQPDYQRSHVAISEFPGVDPVFSSQGTGYFPGGGRAVQLGAVLTFRHDGVYVEVRASSPALALAGARAVMHG